MSIAGPVTVDTTSVARIAEAVAWPRPPAHDDGIPPVIIPHLFRDHLDVTRDARPSPHIDEDFGRPLNGGARYEFRRRVSLGDVLVRETRLTRVELQSPSEGKVRVLVEVSSSFTADDGAVVALAHQTTIYQPEGDTQ